MAEKKSTVKSNISKGKAASRCPVFKKCGACQMIDMPYATQLRKKHARVQELIGTYCRVESFVGMVKKNENEN